MEKLKFKETIRRPPFLYCKDEDNQYIIREKTGEIIYKKQYTLYSQSDFYFCGETPLGPAFFDARYSAYLYPTENGYKIYSGIFNYPIVVNGKNIVNITATNEEIGVINCYGEELLSNTYEEITIELKITAVGKGKKTEKTIPLFNKFEKGHIPGLGEFM